MLTGSYWLRYWSWQKNCHLELPSCREPAPTGRSLLTAHFGRKSSGSADGVKDEVKDDGKAETEPSKTAEQTSAQSSTQSAQAQKRESEKDEKQEENAEVQDLSCATLYILCIDGAH